MRTTKEQRDALRKAAEPFAPVTAAVCADLDDAIAELEREKAECLRLAEKADLLYRACEVKDVARKDALTALEIATTALEQVVRTRPFDSPQKVARDALQRIKAGAK